MSSKHCYRAHYLNEIPGTTGHWLHAICIACLTIMIIRRALPRLQQPFRPYPTSYLCRTYSTTELSNGITMAYDLHEPPKDSSRSTKAAPIVICHGLFGSKKNNRSISKYAPTNTLIHSRQHLTRLQSLRTRPEASSLRSRPPEPWRLLSQPRTHLRHACRRCRAVFATPRSS